MNLRTQHCLKEDSLLCNPLVTTSENISQPPDEDYSLLVRDAVSNDKYLLVFRQSKAVFQTSFYGGTPKVIVHIP
jgi:hypothetical protein